MSEGFQTVDYANLEFPAKMLVDYVRVYQREGEVDVGCDPKDHPTGDYIEGHLNAYMNCECLLNYVRSWAGRALTPCLCGVSPRTACRSELDDLARRRLRLPDEQLDWAVLSPKTLVIDLTNLMIVSTSACIYLAW